MRAYVVYLWRIVCHTWFVLVECCKLGISLFELMCDWSKFSRVYSSGEISHRVKGETGYYDPGSICSQFDLTWLHHQLRNNHHWQHWILVQGEVENIVLPIPDRYMYEILSVSDIPIDRYSAGDIVTWYEKNKDRVVLHPKTRMWMEKQLEE